MKFRLIMLLLAANFALSMDFSVDWLCFGVVDEDLDKQLRSAVKDGDAQVARDLIARGADVNDVNKHGITLLMQAVLRDYTDVVEVLLETCTNIDVIVTEPTTQYQRSALIIAAGVGRLDILEKLLAAGASVSGKHGCQALLLAAAGNHVEVLATLLDRDVDINVADESGKTALMKAARTGCVDALELLLSRTAELELVDEDGNSALLCVAQNLDKISVTRNGRMYDCCECLEILLDAGDNPNLANKNGDTALILAAKRRSGEAVKALLEKGADVGAVNKDGLTAFDSVVSKSHFHCGAVLHVLPVLLEAGVDIPDDFGGYHPLAINLLKEEKKIRQDMRLVKFAAKKEPNVFGVKHHEA